MSEAVPASHETSPASRPEPAPRGHPYFKMSQIAARLSADLELAAMRCQSAAERRRLRVLSAAIAQVAGCLAHNGVKL
jgi:hypothetical protein